MKITAASFVVSVALLAIFGIPEGSFACEANESSNDCGKSCETTCATIDIADQIFCLDVCRPGCYCNDGFVRAYKNSTVVGPCVARESCSQYTTGKSVEDPAA